MIVLAAKSSIPESVYEFESIIEKPSEEAGKPFPMTFATCKASRNLNEWKEDQTDDKKAANHKYEGDSEKSEDQEHEKPDPIPQRMPADGGGFRPRGNF